jgi:hypothetical protein
MVDEPVAKVAGMFLQQRVILWKLPSEWMKRSSPVMTLISAGLSRSQPAVLLWNWLIARSPN